MKSRMTDAQTKDSTNHISQKAKIDLKWPSSKLTHEQRPGTQGIAVSSLAADATKPGASPFSTETPSRQVQRSRTPRMFTSGKATGATSNRRRAAGLADAGAAKRSPCRPDSFRNQISIHEPLCKLRGENARKPNMTALRNALAIVKRSPQASAPPTTQEASRRWQCSPRERFSVRGRCKTTAIKPPTRNPSKETPQQCAVPNNDVTGPENQEHAGKVSAKVDKFFSGPHDKLSRSPTQRKPAMNNLPSRLRKSNEEANKQTSKHGFSTGRIASPGRNSPNSNKKTNAKGERICSLRLSHREVSPERQSPVSKKEDEDCCDSTGADTQVPQAKCNNLPLLRQRVRSNMSSVKPQPSKPHTTSAARSKIPFPCVRFLNRSPSCSSPSYDEHSETTSLRSRPPHEKQSPSRHVTPPSRSKSSRRHFKPSTSFGNSDTSPELSEECKHVSSSSSPSRDTRRISLSPAPRAGRYARNKSIQRSSPTSKDKIEKVSREFSRSLIREKQAVTGKRRQGVKQREEKAAAGHPASKKYSRSQTVEDHKEKYSKEKSAYFPPTQSKIKNASGDKPDKHHLSRVKGIDSSKKCPANFRNKEQDVSPSPDRNKCSSPVHERSVRILSSKSKDTADTSKPNHRRKYENPHAKKLQSLSIRSPRSKFERIRDKRDKDVSSTELRSTSRLSSCSETDSDTGSVRRESCNEGSGERDYNGDERYSAESEDESFRPKSSTDISTGTSVIDEQGGNRNQKADKTKEENVVWNMSESDVLIHSSRRRLKRKDWRSFMDFKKMARTDSKTPELSARDVMSRPPCQHDIPNNPRTPPRQPATWLDQLSPEDGSKWHQPSGISPLPSFSESPPQNYTAVVSDEPIDQMIEEEIAEVLIQLFQSQSKLAKRVAAVREDIKRLHMGLNKVPLPAAKPQKGDVKWEATWYDYLMMVVVMAALFCGQLVLLNK